MAATPKPIRHEIKKSDLKDRERLKKLDKTKSVMPKPARKVADKIYGAKKQKADTKYMVESTMKHKKDISGMRK